jgi:hypothetical protein
MRARGWFAATLLVGASTLGSLACHEDPNTGLPRAGVRLPWRTYDKCPRPIETYVVEHAPSRSYRLLSRVSVVCTHYVPDECDDALRARACELGGDAVLVEGLDESSTPSGIYRRGGAKKLRSASIVVWDDNRVSDAGLGSLGSIVLE